MYDAKRIELNKYTSICLHFLQSGDKAVRGRVQQLPVGIICMPSHSNQDYTTIFTIIYSSIHFTGSHC